MTENHRSCWAWVFVKHMYPHRITNTKDHTRSGRKQSSPFTRQRKQAMFFFLLSVPGLTSSSSLHSSYSHCRIQPRGNTDFKTTFWVLLSDIFFPEHSQGLLLSIELYENYTKENYMFQKKNYLVQNMLYCFIHIALLQDIVFT